MVWKLYCVQTETQTNTISVARAGIEPGIAGLLDQRSDHPTMLSSIKHDDTSGRLVLPKLNIQFQFWSTLEYPVKQNTNSESYCNACIVKLNQEKVE